MKKILFTVLFGLGLIALNNTTFAQCGIPTLDSTCYASLIGAGGGICKDTLPDGMAGQPYDEDVSFVMPASINITTPISATVTLRDIIITGTSGLPTGLGWATNKSDNTYHPSAGDGLGAMKICGTPLSAGTYLVTVYITANVTVSGVGDRDGELQTYQTYITILPDTSGGATTFTNSPGGNEFCNAVDLNFDANIAYSGNRVTYDWDFGNGNTGTGKTPSMQSYAASSTPYIITLKTTIYAWRAFRVKVNGSNSSKWTGDVGELTSLQSPDFTFTDNTTGFIFPEKTNQKTPQWTGYFDTIPVGTDTISYTLTDIDGGFFGLDPNDVVAQGKIAIPTVGGITNLIWNDGDGTYGEIEFDDVPYDIIWDTLHLSVHEPVSLPATAIDNEVICSSDSSVVSIPISTTDYNIEWYDGAGAIPLANDSSVTAKNAGIYYCTVIDPTIGCSAISDTVSLTVYAMPTAAPTVIRLSDGRLAISNYPGTPFVIEWYKDGVLIAGETTIYLNSSGDGSYTAKFVNPDHGDCSWESTNPYVISGLGDKLTADKLMQLYPNPSNGMFTVKMDASINLNNASLICKDILGRTVYSMNITSRNVLDNVIIDLEKGNYLIELVTEQGIYTQKLMVK